MSDEHSPLVLALLHRHIRISQLARAARHQQDTPTTRLLNRCQLGTYSEYVTAAQQETDARRS